MNTDDLRRVLAEHEDLAPGTSGMIDRIRERARRRTRRRRRAATTSAVAAVAAIAVSVPLTLTDPGSGQPVGGSPPSTTGAPPGPDDHRSQVELPFAVDDATDGPRVVGYHVGASQWADLTGSIRIDAVPDFDPSLDTALAPVKVLGGTGYAAKFDDATAVLYWRYAPNRWAEAYGASLDELISLVARVRDEATPLRFPFQLDDLAGLDPAVVSAYEATGTQGVVSRLGLAVGHGCPPALSPSPPGPPCAAIASVVCDPSATLPDPAGASPATNGDCRSPSAVDIGGMVSIEVSDRPPMNLVLVTAGDNTYRITGPDHTGLTVKRDGWYVTVVVPFDLDWPGDREDGVQRILSGLTLLPVNDRSAWTGDPLP